MSKIIRGFALTLGAVAVLTGAAGATPSTTYWTPATSDIQPYGVWHLGIDNYFTLGKKKASERGSLPADVGLTVGVLPYEKVQLEVGIDWLEPSAYPLFFNAKLGTPEGSLFEGSPALNIGVFGVGTNTSVDSEGNSRTDFNIVDLIAGKTLPGGLGRIHIGVYSGNDNALLDKNGDKANTGFMIGYDMGFMPVKEGKSGKDEYNRLVLAADYASGKNAIGGGGVGMYYYFTKDISLLTGPVWFNEPSAAIGNNDISWVWTTQLDINF